MLNICDCCLFVCGLNSLVAYYEGVLLPDYLVEVLDKTLFMTTAVRLPELDQEEPALANRPSRVVTWSLVGKPTSMAVQINDGLQQQPGR